MGNGDGGGGYLSRAESGIKAYTSECESEGETRLSTNHPGGENSPQRVYGSGNEADQSHSFLVDDEEPGEIPGLCPDVQLENGHASLTELLMSMSQQVLPKQQM
jgi:hypothetical protein